MAEKIYINHSDQQAKENIKEIIYKSLDWQDLTAMERLNMKLTQSKALTVKEKVIFFRLMATMLNAWVSITHWLNMLHEQITFPKLKLILWELYYNVNSWNTLADAMEIHWKDFTEAEVWVVRAWESSGKLDTCFISMSAQAEKSAGISKKLIWAMIYPIVIVLLLVLAIFAIMMFVMPNIKELFESFNSDLPWMTQLLIDFSDFMVAKTFGVPKGAWVLLIMFITIVLINIFRKTNKGKPIFDAILLKAPIFWTLNKKVAIAKFSRWLSMLLESGISILKALNICSWLVWNELYRRRILIIEEDVKNGMLIADNIKDDNKFFYPMVVNMIRVWEKTSQLDVLSGKIADFYEEDVDTTIESLSSILEPIIIVVVGLSVWFLVVATMLPMLSLSDIVS